MVAIEGVAFGIVVTLVGGAIAGAASSLSALHGRVISVEPEDARTLDGMRTVLLKGAGILIATFGVAIAGIALAS
ncbi:hypothetical protein [Halorubellus salinus]|uniref:hypothetical protein n=1 Tax=Halorubellus salinus TaxID=755309 RepID=UPI001D07BECF|nr:hypothetical protein [Halorubellus salinus]